MIRIANYEYKSEPVQVQRPTENLTPLPHLHKELEIVVVEKGSMTAFADENVCTVTEGNLYIAFPNQIHYYSHPEGCRFRVLICTPDMFYGIKELLTSNLPENNCVILDDNDPALTYAEQIGNVSGEQAITEYVGLFNLLMSRILPKLRLKPIIASDHSTLHSVLEYCAANYTDEISLDSVAEELHLSRCYISHLFGEKLDIGFNDYINMLRVRQASYYLQNSDKKLADISEEAGFGSIRTFNRAFLKIMGETPGQYAKRGKQ